MAFGVVGTGIVAVGTAAANAAVNVDHALKVSKLQRKFQAHLEKDEINIDYIRNMVLRFQSLGTRLARTSRIQPGTKGFEAYLKKVLINDMIYKGFCNADIYGPMRPTDQPGKPRQIIGKFTRAGHVESSILPRDTGPVWATGCKNAQDNFRLAFIDAFKGTRQFKRIKAHKEDIGVSGLFLRFGTGLFMAVVLLLAIKMQRAVIKKQKVTS